MHIAAADIGEPHRMDLAVHMHQIVKIYPETALKANDEVDLTLRCGEILCLAGENGAGKTTLMKVLYGMEHADSGSIMVRGKAQTISSPIDANRLGIGMVHQHFMLVNEFTVMQNVVLGREPIRWNRSYDVSRANRLVQEVIDRHRFSITCSQRVSSLTVGQKQQVEIVKMLYRDVDILILDEPTAVLTEQETESLFITLRTLAAHGKSVILITHKLNEIHAVSDRVAIMRQGRMIGEFPADSVDASEIARMMMGRNVSLVVDKLPYTKEKHPILSFDSVSVVKRSQQRPLLDNLSFTAFSGEILGFAGVGGNGLGVLEAVLGGFLPVSSGTILHAGHDVSHRDTHSARAQGLAYVPSDRLKVGSALDATVAENLIITNRASWFRHGMLRRKAMMRHAEERIQSYGIRGTALMPIGTLSGGNIQKVVLAREIGQYQDYIVCSEPTWGLDVASSRFVYEKMLRLRDQGAAVLLISSNLDEILALSDRVIVLHRGRLAALLDSDALRTVTKEEMGAYMLGTRGKEAIDA
mgnify:CR=1 FL=1